MNNNKIGIFDSGIGGVTVLKEIIKVLPNEDIYYFSDSKNNPYGDKTDKEILEICNNIVEILLKENYGWQLTNIQKFDEPIEAKGHLSLWKYDDL